MLSIFIQMLRALRALEIGTPGGYNTILMKKALPRQQVLRSLNLVSTMQRLPAKNIINAWLAECVRLHTGAALDVLPTLEASFNLIFYRF